MLKRYQTILTKISPLTTSTDRPTVLLGPRVSYLSLNNRIYSRPSVLFFDAQRQQYVYLPEAVATSALHLHHLQKLTFYQEGQITHVEAAAQFLHIWLQEIQTKKSLWLLNLVSGRYFVPGNTSSAQLLVYKEVFSRLAGSWQPLKTTEVIATLVTLQHQQGIFIGVSEEKIELALVANATLIHFHSLEWGLQKLSHHLTTVLEERYQIQVEPETHRLLFSELLSFYAQEKDKKMSVRGQSTSTHLPVNVVVELADFFPSVFYWLDELKREIHLFYSQFGTREELALTEIITVACPQELTPSLTSFLTTHLKIAVNSLGTFENLLLQS